jgi:hypothetical protein
MARPRSDLNKSIFYFWRHDPGQGPLKESEWKLQFEAHIESISDNSAPSWNDNFDMGRADPKVFYGGYNRSYSINFKVVATNKEEHEANYNNLAKLGRCTMPLYQSGNGFNGTHILFQIGSLIKGYGVITNLTYDWAGDMPWVDNLPLITSVSLGIKLLADPNGVRPNANKSRYFF